MQAGGETLSGAIKQLWGRQSHVADAIDGFNATERLKVLGAFIVCVAVALGVRAIGLTRAFELWVDEMLYALLGKSVSQGQLLPGLPDGPFFLHPPGFFWLEGALISLLGISGDNPDLVLKLRWLNAILGAVTVGLAFLIVRILGNSPAGWLTAGLLSFEPFVLRNNSHVFLETLAMTAVMGGLLLVVTQINREENIRRSMHLFLSGLLMGYAVLTKDFFALCTVVPLVIAVAWRRTLRLHDSARILLGLLIPYASYMCVVAAAGMLPGWIEAKANGIERIMGLQKSTGFTAEGSPGLITRLIDNAGHFASSYILLGLCSVAAALLCFSPRTERRLIGLVSLSLGMYGIYSAAFGTFEEQYGYGVMVAGVLSIALVGVEIYERRAGLGGTVVPAAVVLLLLTAALGLRLETSTDNGFVEVKRWVGDNLPKHAKVSVTNSTGKWAFEEDNRFGVWPSAPLMLENGANYILTQSLPTAQGYGYMEPRMLPWLEENARPLFDLPGLTNGRTILWFIDADALQRGARLGVGTPSFTY